MARSQNMDLTTRGPDQGVVCEITGTNHFLVLNFGTRAIYICTNLSLHVQTNQERITGPVESKSGIIDPRSSHSISHDRCRISRFRAST